MRKFVIAFMLLAFAVCAEAQNKFTREQVLNMTEDDLMELSMEDFAEAIKAVGVSSEDELFALIMNKSVSSASKEEEDTFTSPLSTTVVTRQEIRTYGISTIEEAFRLIPGMIVTEKYNGIYDIQMRGLNNIPDNNVFLYTENANTLLMIDGRPVQNKVMGSINFDMLPIGIEDIERIEVVRGACSALYGADAVNGVINIITERPSALSKEVSGSVQVGNQSTLAAEVALRRAWNDKVALGLSFNTQRRDRSTSKIYLLPNEGQYIPTRATGYIPEAGSPLTYEEAYAYLGRVIDASEGGEYTIEQIQDMRQLYKSSYEDYYRLFSGTEEETPLSSMFPDPVLARNTFGVNGYVSISPSEDINLYVTGGYQKSHVHASPANEDVVAMNGRKSSTGYINVDANIKDLRLVANYMGGIQNYVVGVPGYKMRVDNINVSAEYDLKFDMGLSLRPGFFFQHTCANDYVPVWDELDPIKNAEADEEMSKIENMGIDLSKPGFRSNYKWHYVKPDSKYWCSVCNEEHTGFVKDYKHLSGLFTGEKDINTIAPSLRLDYKINGLRLVAAFRGDKTSNPDKWNRSWQLAASYSINDDNFIRFVYGRANRGSNLVNSCADYTWFRTDMFYPNKLHIGGNEDLTVMHIDNFELGYRWRPTKKILVDAETFYSISKDYGAMMADYGAMQVDERRLRHILVGLAYGVKQVGGFENAMFSTPESTRMLAISLFSQMASNVDMGQVMEPYANVKYSMLPYEVHQMGMSYNIDFIISPKLIAKFNGNFQQTKIDNYYEYHQIEDIKAMLNVAAMSAISLDATTGLPTGQLIDMCTDILTKGADYYKSTNDVGKAMQAAAYEVWGAVFNDENGICEFGQVYGQDIRDAVPQTRSNGFKHKATPSFYGTMGLIYKPVQKFEIAGAFTYIGKRTYNLAYSRLVDPSNPENEARTNSFNLCERFTVNLKMAYKPTDQFEIFFNGHNLLNNKKREFVMNDKIGGLYTIGATFAF